MKCPICNSDDNYIDRVVKKVYHLVRCKNCSFVFFDFDEKIAEKHNTNYDLQAISDYENQQGIIDKVWFENKAKKLVEFSGIEKGKILDVGCGNGLFLKAFIDLGWEAYGVDPSGWAKPFAKKYGFKLFTDKIQDFNGHDNTFDIVVSTSTLEHLSKPNSFAENCLRCLKKGGSMYIGGVPNYLSLTKRLRLSWFKDNHPAHHVSFFSPSSMEFLFSKYDLNKVKISTYGISGLYTFFSVLKSIFKRKKHKKSLINEEADEVRIDNKNIDENVVIKSDKKKAGGFKKLVAKIFLFFYEKLRLPGCGDKISVIIKK